MKMPPATRIADEPVEPGRSPWRDAWLRLRKNRLAVFGGGVLILVALACIVGPWLSPYGYADISLDHTFAAPGARNCSILGRPPGCNLCENKT